MHRWLWFIWRMDLHESQRLIAGKSYGQQGELSHFLRDLTINRCFIGAMRPTHFCFGPSRSRCRAAKLCFFYIFQNVSFLRVAVMSKIPRILNGKSTGIPIPLVVFPIENTVDLRGSDVNDTRYGLVSKKVPQYPRVYHHFPYQRC